MSGDSDDERRRVKSAVRVAKMHQMAVEGARAKAAYDAAAEAILKKTARLRALRLAKEAADGAAIGEAEGHGSSRRSKLERGR